MSKKMDKSNNFGHMRSLLHVNDPDPIQLIEYLNALAIEEKVVAQVYVLAYLVGTGRDEAAQAVALACSLTALWSQIKDAHDEFVPTAKQSVDALNEFFAQMVDMVQTAMIPMALLFVRLETS